MRAIGQALAGKDDAVAGKTRIDVRVDPVTAAVAEVSDDIRTGILVEGAFELRMLPATDIDVEPGTDLSQTPDFEHPWEWAGQAIEELVNHDGIKFVRERRGAIVRIVGDVPAQFQRPLGVGLRQVDGDSPALGEGVHGETREHRLGAQDAERCVDCLMGNGAERWTWVCPPEPFQGMHHTRLCV